MMDADVVGNAHEGEPSSRPAASLPTPTSAPVITTTTTSTTTSTGASTSASTAGADAKRPETLQLRSSRRASGARIIRRVTTQERLDEILEVGRQRAESMSPARSPPAFRSPMWRASLGGGGSTPPTSNSPFFREQDLEVTQPPHEPDETTEIVPKGLHSSAQPAMNYQSMAPMESNVTRARKPGSTAPRSNTGRRRENANGDGTACDEAGGDGHERNKEAEAWWRTQLAKFGSIELENKGSVARDHLALERTFLAWLRTSLSFASIGVAITQLFRLNTSLVDANGRTDSPNEHTLRHLGKPLGGIFLGISILILFLGYHRYFQAQQWIIKGKFPASRGTVILVSLVALCLMVISLVVVLLVQPAQSAS